MSLSTLDLNLLVVLDTVLTERSVARAARRLHVTPSAVSNALARLRDVLGDPLVVRSGRGIVPTPRALALAPRLTRALRELDQSVHGVRFEPATTTRAFTLAVADVGQVVRVPVVAAMMRNEMPCARLRVVGIDSLVSMGGLSGPDIDLALGVGDSSPGMHVESVFDEPMSLVARADHTAARRPITQARLEQLHHVGVEMVPGKNFRDPVALTYMRAGVARVVVATVPTFTAAAAMVAGTDLVTTIPSSLLEVLGPRLGVRRISGAVPAHGIAMKLSWHERTHDDEGMLAFRDLVRRALRVPTRLRGSSRRRAPGPQRPKNEAC